MAKSARALDDPIAKINDEIAVGSDLGFQRKWWRFERAIWVVFTAIVVLDVLGAFGQGVLASARASTGDNALTVEYERIARYGTPSILTVHFGPAAIRDGGIGLWASDTLLQSLGLAHVNPEPAAATLAGAGLLYRFPSAPQPNSIQFALEPRAIGRQLLTLRVDGGSALTLRIFVVP